MATRVYPIHRAAGRPVVFKGFRGPYILIAGLALVTDLLLFVLLYVSGLAPWVCILLVFGLAWAALTRIAGLSRHKNRIGASYLVIRFRSRRQLFKPLNSKNYVQNKARITADDGILRADPHQ